MSSQKRKKRDVAKFLRYFGYLLIIASVFIVLRIFYPVATAEIGYQAKKVVPQKSKVIPVNTDFSIQIPKIGVNANVVKNVDPYNPAVYQQALTKGVAHAKGSGLPGFFGNTFIFAHSASTWYQANQYNAIFYLINKLESSDEIDLYYQGSKYSYHVLEKKIVSSSDINYLSNSLNTNTLTLMTCWPPGTTLKRLIVVATPFQK